MTTFKLYPDQLNPFGEEDEEEKKEDDDDKNPFKSDDDDDEIVPQITTNSHPKSATSPQTLSEPSSVNGTKPSPLPRRSLLQNSDRPQSAVEARLPISPLPPRIDVSVGDLSTTLTKRRAPSIPLADGKKLTPLPSPEKSPVSGMKKKLAPPPPGGTGSGGAGNGGAGNGGAGRRQDADQRRKSSTDVDVRSTEERLHDVKLSSGQSSSSLTTRRDSSAAHGSLTPDRHSLSQHFASSTEDVEDLQDLEEQQYFELMRTLKMEHQTIEAELRELIAVPLKLKSASQTAREQRLMKDLLENVKKRDELEGEEEDHDLQTSLGDAGNPGDPPKKMKKKRNFKIKSLLGVK